jgi:N-acetylglucosaminyl-diphospho-decaprenol L-rhamnosyltransferase
MTDTAIVIVNFNTRDELANCLRSIAASRGPYTHRVIVVDNHSSDGSAEMVRREYPWVELVASEKNGGYPYANNVGLRVAGFGAGAPEAGDAPRYALLLNPDTVLPPDALAEMVAFLDEHPDVGAAGPKLVRQDGTLDRACRRSFPSPIVSFYHMTYLDRLFPRSPRLARYNLTYLDEDAEADVDALVGAFMLIRREALEGAGLLDEAFFMYGEDLDLCYRIRQGGWRIVYHPQVRVLHIKGASTRKASARSILAFYDAMRIFHRKHYRARTFFLVNWVIEGSITLMQWLALLRDRLRPPERRRVASA